MADISGIFSFDSDLLKIYTECETIHEMIDKRCFDDRELDLCDAFFDCVLMEEIHGKREVRSDLMTLADMRDPVEEKKIVESRLGIDDESCEPPDPSLIRKAWQENMRGLEETSLSPCLATRRPSRSRRQVHRSALRRSQQGYKGGAARKEEAGWSRICSWRSKG